MRLTEEDISIISTSLNLMSHASSINDRHKISELFKKIKIISIAIQHGMDILISLDIDKEA